MALFSRGIIRALARKAQTRLIHVRFRQIRRNQQYLIPVHTQGKNFQTEAGCSVEPFQKLEIGIFLGKI